MARLSGSSKARLSRAHTPPSLALRAGAFSQVGGVVLTHFDAAATSAMRSVEGAGGAKKEPAAHV